jgi:hypothetical protein
MIAHAMEDDFTAFLDRSQMIRSKGDGAHAGHALYSEMLNKHTIFNHHDPSSDAGSAYFQRAVQRFRLILGSNEPKLFVIFSLEHRDALDDEALKQLFVLLASRTTDFKMVAVKIFSPAPAESTSFGPHAIQQYSANDGTCSLQVHEFICRGGLGNAGLTLLDPADNKDLSSLLFQSGTLWKQRFTPDPLGRPDIWRSGGPQKYASESYMVHRRHLQIIRA